MEDLERMIGGAVGLSALGVVALLGYVTLTRPYKIARDVINAFKEGYTRTTEKRAEVTIELARLGKTNEEIKQYMDAALPLPTYPEIKVDA